ncbi:hypothetical protein BDV26DRAFT_265715 [Aspergillus bertholletiae]|uniref:Uncharacterized protein n=1 Tax=Aspergillus bertholletiae TaxID=1226010 RepID=A0A5N7B324_9EURO|nr:hypothetical protein BDV26DRAFT_265715 [Aspergillus bertholletiae]
MNEMSVGRVLKGVILVQTNGGWIFLVFFHLYSSGTDNTYGTKSWTKVLAGSFFSPVHTI